MQPLTLQEIHETELNILVDIDRFCRENGIRYSLDGGTLLGAVRHHGFIPWDDDIDIIMPREDYNRFVKSYHSEDGRYRLYNKDTNPAYRTQMFSKVIDTQTVADEGLYEQQDAYGLWVDVFPADYVPTRKHACRRIMRKFYRYRHLLYVRNLKDCQKTLKDRFVEVLYFWKTNRSLLRSLDRYASRQEKTEMVGNLAFVCRDLTDYIFSVTMFDHLTDFEFEGKRFLGFEAFDPYLRQGFGEYMVLPPPEKRATHYVTAYRK